MIQLATRAARMLLKLIDRSDRPQRGSRLAKYLFICWIDELKIIITYNYNRICYDITLFMQKTERSHQQFAIIYQLGITVIKKVPTACSDGCDVGSYNKPLLLKFY